MKITFKGAYKSNTALLLRRAGYHPFVDPVTHKQSFVRTLRTGSYYPRFHLYLESVAGGFIVDVHLDQKKPSYNGAHAHNGEYDGEVVKCEAARIWQVFEASKQKKTPLL